jgi:MULE transposase domain
MGHISENKETWDINLTPGATVNTNMAGYEISTVMAEANGQGIPLGLFMHVSTNGTAASGAKGQVLNDFLAYYARKCPNIKFTLSDKESSEIKAMHTTFPHAKHICCFWHATTYIDEQLAKNIPPVAYNPHSAHHILNFIDPTWHQVLQVLGMLN